MKVLQVRSAAIQSALNKYNSIAGAMRPCHCILKWEEVVEYAFLSDFDLLQDGRQDISKLPWVSPMGCHVMDLHFKTCCTREEIQHLNIEIRQLVMYIHDEETYLHECESCLKAVHPGLAYQVSHHQNVHGHFTLKHLKRLGDIASLHGFSGTLVPRECMVNGLGESAGPVSVRIPMCMLRGRPMDIADTPGGGIEIENDWEDEEDAEDLVGVFPCIPEG